MTGIKHVNLKKNMEMPPTCINASNAEIINSVAIIFCIRFIYYIRRVYSAKPIIKLIIDIAQLHKTCERARHSALKCRVMKCVNIKKMKSYFNYLSQEFAPTGQRVLATLINDTRKINTLCEFMPPLFPPCAATHAM